MPKCDLSEWPTAKIYPGTDGNTAEAADVMIGYCRDACARAEKEGIKMGIIFDTQGGNPPDSAVRKHTSDELRKIQGLLLKHCAGFAYVVENGFHRGVLTAIFWMFKPPYKVNVFSAQEDAKNWIRENF